MRGSRNKRPSRYNRDAPVLTELPRLIFTYFLKNFKFWTAKVAEFEYEQNSLLKKLNNLFTIFKKFASKNLGN